MHLQHSLFNGYSNKFLSKVSANRESAFQTSFCPMMTSANVIKGNHNHKGTFRVTCTANSDPYRFDILPLELLIQRYQSEIEQFAKQSL